jgi:guanylate cyclase
MLMERASEKSQELEKSLNLADSWKKKGDDLLYSMIPRSVADRLKSGIDPLTTCQTFEEVSVLFAEIQEESDIVDPIESAILTVSTLNSVFSAFDELIQTPIYKVETVGKIYMVVSGCPDKHEYHLEAIADLAMKMLAKTENMKIGGKSVSVKIGIHCGPVSAGIVGTKSKDIIELFPGIFL